MIDPDAVEHIPATAASTYAKLAKAYGDEFYRRVARDLHRHAGDVERILDVGTGPGYLPLRIAALRPDVEIHAIDFSAPLVEIGHNLARTRDLRRRVSFFVADAYHLPVRSGKYGGIVSTGVLHALDRPADAVTEWHRVVSPGGWALVFDPVMLAVPDDQPDVLTDREQEIYEAYGARGHDADPSLTESEARTIIAATPFECRSIDVGPAGTLRIALIRPAAK